MAKQMEVVVNCAIDEIRASVDEISDDSFFTYGWFKTLEEFGRLPEPLYLSFRYHGDTKGIAPCFIDKTEDFFSWGPNILPFLKGLLQVSQKLGFFQKNLLLCYSPACCRTKILFSNDYYQEPGLRAISEKIDEICAENKILFSSFLFVSQFDQVLMKNLKSLDYLRFPNIITYFIDITWPSFDDYIKSLKGRTSIRREIKQFLKSGVTIAEEAISEDIAEKLSELAANTSLKHNENSRLPPSFFLKLKEHARDRVRLLVARKNSQIIGFVLFLQQKDMLDGYMCGFDYEAMTDVPFLYFNLCYYKPVQLAIDEKIKKIYYRYFLGEARLSRGCKSEQTYTFVKCHSKVLSPIINSLLKNPVYTYVRVRALQDYFEKK